MPASDNATTKRVMVRIDVRDGRVAHEVKLPGLRDAHDPVELAGRYESEGADGILLLDASESPEGRLHLGELVRRAATRVHVPLMAGGSLTTLEQIDELLRAGAAKAILNDAAVADPDLLHHAVERHGSERILLAIDVREERRQIEIEARPEVDASHAAGPQPVHNWFRVFTHAGTTPTPLDAIMWARRGVELGAGEVLITSIDRRGSGDGYDLELTARLNEAVEVAVVAGGGAGSADHVRELFLLAGADGAVAGGLFHDAQVSVRAVKRVLAQAGIRVRLEDAPPMLS